VFEPPKDDYYVAASNGSCEGPVSKIILKDHCPTSVSDEEGHVYKVVSLAGFCWTENLRTTIYPGTSNLISFANPYTCSVCPSNLEEIFGLIYTWYAAVGAEIGDAPTLPVQGICPGGYHIPSQDEWNVLDNYTAEQLNSTQFWLSPPGAGNDNFKFTALPAGWFNDVLSRFEGIYGFTGWWASNSTGVSVSANYYSIQYYCDKPLLQTMQKHNGLSVRCIMDK